MKKPTILVADRNRNIRAFICREMTVEGYECLLSNNAEDVLNKLKEISRIDILVLDPDIPGILESELWNRIRIEMPNLPVIIHSLPTIFIDQPWISNVAAFVEKNGNSIDRLKILVFRILKKIP